MNVDKSPSAWNTSPSKGSPAPIILVPFIEKKTGFEGSPKPPPP